MTFDPLGQRGIPLDGQLRNWRELNVSPLDPDRADPYTRCRMITMNGIGTEGPHPELRQQQPARQR